MKRIATMCAWTVLTLTAAGCNQVVDNHDADVKAIQGDDAQWNLDLASKDAEKITSHYAGDAVLMAPGMPAISGKDAIRNAFKEMVSDPGMSMKFEAARIEVAKSGDVAFTQGSYTMTMTDPQSKKVIEDHGSYVTTYRKQPDGTWKAVEDIASSAVPPAAPGVSKNQQGGH